MHRDGVEVGAAVAQRHRRVLLPGDDVGVGDDQPALCDPARALDRRGRRPCRGRGRRCRRPRRPPGRRPASGRAGRRARTGPLSRRPGVDPVERVEHEARRRQQVVEASEDRGVLHLGAQLRRVRARGGRRRRTSRRGRARGRRRAEPRRRRRSRLPPRRARPAREARGRRPRPKPRSARRPTPPRERDRRRVWRLGAAREQQRRAEAAADHRAEREPGEGQGADDQALAISPDRHREREGDDAPVQHGHPSSKPGKAGR